MRRKDVQASVTHPAPDDPYLQATSGGHAVWDNQRFAVRCRHIPAESHGRGLQGRRPPQWAGELTGHRRDVSSSRFYRESRLTLLNPGAQWAEFSATHRGGENDGNP